MLKLTPWLEDKIAWLGPLVMMACVFFLFGSVFSMIGNGAVRFLLALVFASVWATIRVRLVDAEKEKS